VIAAAVHRGMAARHPGLVTVIVPRHPVRGPAIRDALAGTDGTVALRSAGDDLPAAAGLYVADTMGELGLWYRLAELVFIGGSLVPHGGQNPLEAARLGCALLYGTGMSNFGEIAADLVAAGAAETVRDENTLAAAVDRLLADAPRRHARAEAAQRYAAAQANVVDTVTAALEPYLRRLDTA
jgi:3-deoxy-D-manno-octulosonic-acid transferase